MNMKNSHKTVGQVTVLFPTSPPYIFIGPLTSLECGVLVSTLFIYFSRLLF